MILKSILEFEQLAKRIRIDVLKMVNRTATPHIGPCFSCVEGLVALFFRWLSLSPEKPEEPDQDRFILSKGHAAPALYAVLGARGFIDPATLEGFGINGGTLEHHPRMARNWGVDFSTGSLGHGLAVGAGLALASKLDGSKYRVAVLMSDGELDEGSNWEAIMFAAHHRLDRLLALVDLNRMQALGFTHDILDLNPLADKWRAFGWKTQEVDGHCFYSIFTAMDNLAADRPNVIILNTTKGKGVSFMENQLLWHYRYPHDGEEYDIAMKELSR